jgi:hypothetical protein
MGVIPRLRTAREEISSTARHPSRPSASARDDRCRKRDVAVAANGSAGGSLAQASPYPSFHRRFCEPSGEGRGRGGRRPAFGRSRCGPHGDDRRRGLSGRSLLEQRRARQRGRMRPSSAVGACGALTPIQLRLGTPAKAGVPSLRILPPSRGKGQSPRPSVSVQDHASARLPPSLGFPGTLRRSAEPVPQNARLGIGRDGRLGAAALFRRGLSHFFQPIEPAKIRMRPSRHH